MTTSDKAELLQWVSENVDSELEPEEIIERSEVESYQSEKILQESDIMDNIDVIQVDAEGVDDKIVYSFLDAGIYPSIINIEKRHLSNSEIEVFNNRLKSGSYEVYDYTASELLGLR